MKYPKIIIFIILITGLASTYTFAQSSLKKDDKNNRGIVYSAKDSKDAPLKASDANLPKQNTSKVTVASVIPGHEADVPIVCNGDIIEFYQQNRKVVARGNVVITFKDLKMTCDEAEVDMQTKEAYAKGNVVFYKQDATFKGSQFKYNFDKKIGSAADVYLSYKPWYGKLKEASKLGDKQFRMKHGYMTTCDRQHPHYRFQAGQADIYMGNRIELKNVAFFVGDIPILYIPRYVHSLKENRPGVTVLPGYRKEWGAYVQSWWKYYLNESFKGRVKIDYRQYQGLAVGFDHPIVTKKFGEGIIRYYYAKEGLYQLNVKDTKQKGKRATTNPEGSTERWHVQFRHKWDINNENTFVTEYYRASDSDFRKFYFPIEYRKEKTPESYVLFARNRQNYLFNMYLKVRTNNWEDLIEKLPETQFDVPNYRLVESDFYYKGHYQLDNFNRKRVHTNWHDSLFRFDTYNQITYSKKILGFLNISPYMATEQTWYTKYLEPDTTANSGNIVRGSFHTGMSLSARFFKTYDTTSQMLSINKLRHIVSPSISYGYVTRPTIRSEKLMQFDSVDSLNRSNAFTFSIENKIQTKRGNPGSQETVDLARLLMNMPYYIASKNGKSGSTFGDGDMQFELKPSDWMHFQSKASWGTKYDQRYFKTFETEMDVFKKDDKYKSDFSDSRYDPFVNLWDLGAGYRYSHDDSSNLEFDAAYKILSKLKLRYYTNFDFSRISSNIKTINKPIVQEFSAMIDLHCWTAEFVYTNEYQNGNSFMLVFRLKAYPETPISQGFKYHSARQGSQDELNSGY